MKKWLKIGLILILSLSGCRQSIIVDEGPFTVDNTGKFPEGRYVINHHSYYGVGYLFDLADEPEFKDLEVYIIHSEMEMALLLAIMIDHYVLDFYYVEDRIIDYEQTRLYLTALLVNEVEIEDGILDLPSLKQAKTVYTYSFTYDFKEIHQVENAIDEWTYGYKTSLVSDREKAEYSLIDLLEQAAYDDEALNDDNRMDAAYTALGVFQEGLAVCNGYSQAYMGLLKDLDIPAIMVSSEKDDHAWNMIYVDKAWFYVDATWEDDTYATSEYWTYFLLDQAELEVDHRFDSGRGETLNAEDYIRFAEYVFPKTNDAMN